MILARTTRRTESNSMDRAQEQQGFGNIWRKEDGPAWNSVDIWRLGTESGEEIDRGGVMKQDERTMGRIGLELDVRLGQVLASLEDGGGIQIG